MTEDAYHDEIDLREVFSVLWTSKVLILCVTLCSAAGSVGYALSLPNIYTSSALLSPSEDSGGGLSGVLSQYSGLASMAGVALPGSNAVSKAGLAMEVLRSRAFAKEFISKHGILPELLAFDHWDSVNRRAVINPDIYDSTTGKWFISDISSDGEYPTHQEAYSAFSAILNVDQDIKTNLITITIKHQSPDIARQWVHWLVEDVNETMRRKEIREAEESIEYLKKQAAETNLADLDNVFFELIQAQMQRMMLAEVRREFALTTIDPAIAPELRSEPRRSFICIVGTILGGILALLISFGRHYGLKLWYRGESSSLAK